LDVQSTIGVVAAMIKQTRGNAVLDDEWQLRQMASKRLNGELERPMQQVETVSIIFEDLARGSGKADQ
jgi:hypothetical protein